MGHNWTRLTRNINSGSGSFHHQKPCLKRCFMAKRYLIQKCCTAYRIFCIHTYFVKSKKVFHSFFEGYCNPSVTAIESWMGDGKTYIFKGDRFWRLNDAKAETDRGYPKTISSKWINVPDDIDEVFLWGHNWNTYFFKGHQYYKFNDLLGQVDNRNYPKRISEGWPGLPADGIDAGFSYSNAQSYFFKGDKVYLYDNFLDRVDPNYPSDGKLISDVWRGLPNNVDSAFRWYWDGISYFFKDDSYYWWDDSIKSARGPFLIGDTAWKNICDV